VNKNFVFKNYRKNVKDVFLYLVKVCHWKQNEVKDVSKKKSEKQGIIVLFFILKFVLPELFPLEQLELFLS
jgi:hypothetical protein